MRDRTAERAAAPIRAGHSRAHRGSQRRRPEMRADPGQPERQDDRRCRTTARDQGNGRGGECGRRGHQGRAVDDAGAGPRSGGCDTENGGGKKGGYAPKQNNDGHRPYLRRLVADRPVAESDGFISPVAAFALSRTPRPPPWLEAPSPMSSMPAPSRAPTSFISESTLPRMTPSLASMRWIVGTESPERSASLRWSMPRSARAARSCAAEIISKASNIIDQR